MSGRANDQRYACGFAVFEFFPDVLILVRGERDRAGCGQRKTCVSVLSCPGGYLIGGSQRQVDVFEVYCPRTRSIAPTPMLERQIKRAGYSNSISPRT
jgi:hypothetical protein